MIINIAERGSTLYKPVEVECIYTVKKKERCYNLFYDKKTDSYYTSVPHWDTLFNDMGNIYEDMYGMELVEKLKREEVYTEGRLHCNLDIKV